MLRLVSNGIYLGSVEDDACCGSSQMVSIFVYLSYLTTDFLTDLGAYLLY